MRHIQLNVILLTLLIISSIPINAQLKDALKSEINSVNKINSVDEIKLNDGSVVPLFNGITPDNDLDEFNNNTLIYIKYALPLSTGIERGIYIKINGSGKSNQMINLTKTSTDTSFEYYEYSFYITSYTEFIGFSWIDNLSNNVAEQFENEFKLNKHTIWTTLDSSPLFSSVTGAKEIIIDFDHSEHSIGLGRQVQVNYTMKSTNPKNMRLIVASQPDELFINYNSSMMTSQFVSNGLYSYHTNISLESRELWFTINSDNGWEHNLKFAQKPRIHRLFNGFSLENITLEQNSNRSILNDTILDIDIPRFSLWIINETGAEILKGNYTINGIEYIATMNKIVSTKASSGNYSNYEMILPRLDVGTRFSLSIYFVDKKSGYYSQLYQSRIDQYRVYSASPISNIDADGIIYINTGKIKLDLVIDEDLDELNVTSSYLELKNLNENISYEYKVNETTYFYNLDLNQSYGRYSITLNVTNIINQTSISQINLIYDITQPIVKDHSMHEIDPVKKEFNLDLEITDNNENDSYINYVKISWGDNLSQIYPLDNNQYNSSELELQITHTYKTSGDFYIRIITYDMAMNNKTILISISILNVENRGSNNGGLIPAIVILITVLLVLIVIIRRKSIFNIQKKINY